MSAPQTPSLSELLAQWLPVQRWFAAKGPSSAVRLVHAGGLRLPDQPDHRSADTPAGGHPPVGVEVHIVTATTHEGKPTTYQLPLTYRATPDPDLAHAEIGVLDHPDLGRRHVYDGPHDPVFVRAWLELMAGTPDEATVPVRGVMQRTAPPPTGPSYVVRGEQSNTSIIVDPRGADPVIVKLFRVLHGGQNPDVVVQSRLAALGCDRVPRPVGWIEGEWTAPDGSPAHGHLAYACEFLVGSEDAWRVACQAVEAGQSFAAEAYELGAATAAVHTALASAMPTQPTDPDALNELADGLVKRVAWAISAVPDLAPLGAAATTVVDSVRWLAGAPDRQQLHGDYHLGQVLHTASRGWVLFDFEGEPLRPLADRLKPDVALRDIAGMLRSFDYAARHATVGLPDDDPRTVEANTWAQECREAFLDAYADAGGHDPRKDPALLKALELDKAMYEVVYETLNRPAWVGIPLSAVRRLLTEE